MTLAEEQRLTVLLEQAARDPVSRPAFYRALLEGWVYVPGHTDQPHAGEGQCNPPAGARVYLKRWERDGHGPVIPCFTSRASPLSRAVSEGEPYLRLPARSLFAMAGDTALVLNPADPCGRVFSPWEIRNLLEHGMPRAAEERVIEEPTQVLLAQPREQPARLIDALTQLFARRANVKRSFLALMVDPGLGEAPRLVVGLEVDGEFEPVMAEAGNVARDTAPLGQAVDLCQVQPGEGGVSEYLLTETEPFYERRWGRRLFGMLKPRRG